MKERVRFQRLVVLGVVIVAAAVAFIVVTRANNAAQRQPILAQLVAKNYRELSPSLSHRLVLYAQAEYRCLAKSGVNITKPTPSPTRITMRVPHKTAREIVHLQMQCDPEVGPPPAKATLQARMEQILVYLPKWCLLHPTELPNV